MARRPVAEGERVQYGDVFAYTAVKSGAVPYRWERVL